jgi:uncharacterized protein (DUF1015 family)
MVQVSPFRGLRFAPRYVADTVFAPPYDVINPQQRLAYLAGDAHSIVHVDLGPAQDTTWYASAARIRDGWLAEGALVRDAQPALYGYQQRFASNGQACVRSGLLGAARLVEWGQGIHRHERTRVGPRADRLALMRALRAQTSPVFGLYRDPANELGRWLMPPEALEVDTTDEQGVRHLFWRITAPEALAGLASALAARDVVIADGHHRYETALAYRAERRAANGNPADPQSYDNVLMYLCAAEDPGLQVLATHRLVSHVQLDARALLHALASDFSLAPVDAGQTLTQAVEQAGREAIALGLCLGAGGDWVLTLRDATTAERAAGDTPTELATLDVCVLQNLVLAPHLGISAEALATGEQVSYTIHEQEARTRVREGLAQAAFILNPTRVDQVWRAALKGVTMPQKSTYFWPKLLTGLVIHPLD